MAQEMEKRINEVCIRILASSRSELYLHMRFLDVALSAFSYVQNPEMGTLGTDGVGLYYNPSYLGGLYRQGRVFVNRAYLHMVFHCIFAHPWKDVRLRKKRASRLVEEETADLLWEVSCDIASEAMIDSIPLHCVRRPTSVLRRETYASLGKKRRVLNAEGVFGALLEDKPDLERLRRLKEEFYVDDHSLWSGGKRRAPSQRPKENWDDIRDKMETELQSFGQDSAVGASEGILEQIKVENRDSYDYRRFLQKFAVLKEEQQIDPDSFDYGFYSYGLSLYGNMPLIEPQESREVKKVEEFVIAIDTSMSCSGELVKAFLKETYSILRETESFFRKINIHIIQCDEVVHSDDKITSQEELKAYMEHLELLGQGGTDFRPVFTRVEELLAKREFTSLKGLLYFTDGKGIFPQKMPRYETAFVLMQKEYEEIDVPAWAIKIYLDQEEMEAYKEGITDEH